MLPETEQCAFLLHSRPYRENQCIIDLLTEQDGKLSAVTYFSNRGKSDKKGLLQPFTPLNVVVSGASSLKKLKLVESAGKRYPLVGNFLYSGFYANEMIIRLIPELVHCGDLYFQYQQLLQRLADKQPIEQCLRLFELAVLDELGLSLDFTPVFTQDASYFSYFPEQGFVATSDNKNAFPKQHLEAIASQEFTDRAAMHSFKLLMRLVFKQLLGNKPLNSRKLFIK